MPLVKYTMDVHVHVYVAGAATSFKNVCELKGGLSNKHRRQDLGPGMSQRHMSYGIGIVS